MNIQCHLKWMIINIGLRLTRTCHYMSGPRLSVKVCSKHKKNDSTYFEFLPDHNQHKTHKVKCITSRSENFILSFIGGSLPRCDYGDYEYYCSTMLTLFKPWRKSIDLKKR